MHVGGMSPTPHSYGVALSGAGVAAAPGEDSILARAHAVLADQGLTVDGLRGRPPLLTLAWHRRIVAALAGEGRFTSLTSALFAEATGIDVLWLITGEQPQTAGGYACVVVETIGADDTAALLGGAR